MLRSNQPVNQDSRKHWLSNEVKNHRCFIHTRKKAPGPTAYMSNSNKNFKKSAHLNVIVRFKQEFLALLFYTLALLFYTFFFFFYTPLMGFLFRRKTTNRRCAMPITPNQIDKENRAMKSRGSSKCLAK